MRQIMSNDQVRLVTDVPELALREGDVGIVRSSWYVPVVAYEVEFTGQPKGASARVLLLEDHITSATALA